MDLAWRLLISMERIWEDRVWLLAALLIAGKLLLFGWLVEAAWNLPPTHTAAVGVLGVVLVGFAPTLLSATRLRYLYLSLFSASASGFALLNLCYARVLARPATTETLLAIASGRGLEPEVVAAWRAVDSLLFVDTAVIVVAGLTRWRRPPPRRRAVPSLLFALVGLLAFLVLPLGRWIGGEPVFSRSDRLQDLVRYNAVGYHIVDGWRALTEDPQLDLTPAQQRRIDSWYTARAKGAAGDRSDLERQRWMYGLGWGKNLIVVQLAQFPRMALDRRRGDTPVAPHLFSLAQQSWVFTNLYAQNREGGPSDAELAVLTSMLPISDGSAFVRFPQNRYRTLPALLAEEGYRSEAFHGQRPGLWNRREVFPRLGFSRVVDRRQLLSDRGGKAAVPDRDLLVEVAGFLTQVPEPFFAYVITAGEAAGASADRRDSLAVAQQLDAAVGTFVEALRHNGLFDNSVLVVFGDRPTESGPDDKEDASGPEWLGSGDRRVPLLIRCPGAGRERVATIGGHIDLLPTIANVMGIPRSRYAAQTLGRNLMVQRGGYAVLTDQTYVGDRSAVTLKGLVFRKEAYLISDLVIRSGYFGMNHKIGR